MQQVAIIGDVFRAEMEERAGGVAIARVAQHVRHQRAIAWPHIGVAVAREGPHITIGRGDNRAAIVDLRAYDQQAALVEVNKWLRQIAGVDGLLSTQSRQ